MYDETFPLTAALVESPYSFYRELRAQIGLVWHGQMKGWLVARHDEVASAFVDDRLSADRLDHLFGLQFDGTAERDAIAGLKRRSMFFLEPPLHGPAHNCARAILSSWPKAEILDRIQRFAADLGRGLLIRGGGDLIAEFARPVSVEVMTSILGLRRERASEVRECIEGFAVLFGGAPPGEGMSLARAAVAVARLEEVIAEIHAEGRFAHLTCMRDAAEHDLATGVYLDLLCAGYLPLTNLIGNAIYCLLSNPDQLVRLRKGHHDVSAAVAEAARFEAPNQFTSRLALRDFDFAGTPIARGEMVYLMLASANRDERIRADADAFDIGRAARPFLSFGSGHHTCIANRFALHAATAAVDALLREIPALSLRCEPHWRIESLRVRGLERLDVTARETALAVSGAASP